LGSQIVSRTFARVGPRRLTVIGFGWLTVFVCTLGLVCAHVGLPLFALLMLLVGMTQALVQLSNQSVAFGQVSHDDVGRASSLHNASRRLGAVFGVASLSSVLGGSELVTVRTASTYRDAFFVAASFALLGLMIEARRGASALWRGRAVISTPLRDDSPLEKVDATRR
jgi:MFS family permease